jgi:hypothetical protein
MMHSSQSEARNDLGWVNLRIFGGHGKQHLYHVIGKQRKVIGLITHGVIATVYFFRELAGHPNRALWTELQTND